MIEWKRILSESKRIALILCIPLICFLLFFYQKTVDAMMADPKEYRGLVEQWRNSAPDEMVAVLSEQFELTENEMRLRAQAEYLADYPGYLDRVKDQAYKMQHSSIFATDPNSYVYRNILKTAKDFAECSGNGIRLGYDRPIQDWLAFSWADWGFLAAVLLLVMSFLDERKKGLAAIVRTCPAGRGNLQVSRLMILLFYCAGMTLLLYYLPLALSLIMDGAWADLARPVQSLAEFQKCTAQHTIAGFLFQFFFVKTACGFLIGVLIWFALSILEQVQLSWILTVVGLSIEYLLYTLVPAQSILSPLRHVNVFSYVFTSKLYTEYVNINLFTYPVGKSTMLFSLLFLGAIILSVVITYVLPKRYPFGNRDRLGKWLHLWNRTGDAIRRRLGMLSFEWYKMLFLTAGGIILVLGFLFSRDLPLNSGAYSRLEDSVYRQYVTQVQGPINQDTYDYITQAKAALEHGKNVVCEKPCTMKLDETKELFKIAREKKLFLMEAEKMLFLPTLIEVKKCIEDGKLGKIYMADMSHSFSSSYNSWMFDAVLGGGPLYSSGIYAVQLLLWLFGDIKKISGEGCTFSDGIAWQYILSGTTESGVLFTAKNSTKGILDNTARIFGEKGWVEIPEYWKARKAIFHIEGSDDEIIEFPCKYELVYEAEHIKKCLDAGLITSPVVTEEISVKGIEILNKIIFDE